MKGFFFVLIGILALGFYLDYSSSKEDKYFIKQLRHAEDSITYYKTRYKVLQTENKRLKEDLVFYKTLPNM